MLLRRARTWRWINSTDDVVIIIIAVSVAPERVFGFAKTVIKWFNWTAASVWRYQSLHTKSNNNNTIVNSGNNNIEAKFCRILLLLTPKMTARSFLVLLGCIASPLPSISTCCLLSRGELLLLLCCCKQWAAAMCCCCCNEPRAKSRNIVKKSYTSSPARERKL